MVAAGAAATGTRAYPGWMMTFVRVGRARSSTGKSWRRRWHRHRASTAGRTGRRRLLARRRGIGNATVARAWRDYGVAPWRVETFTFSTDPELVAKVDDVVGLCLAPPENAVVPCVDE
jgi:hypothetical protein